MHRAVTDPDFRKVLVETLAFESTDTECQKSHKAFKNSESSSKGMNAMESLADTIASFNPVNTFNKFLILVIIILVFTVIVLLAFEYILTYVHKTMRQHKREKAVFTTWLHNR